MVDPSTDDMNREWSYEVRPTVCIGVPWQPDWTHVTYDGALYSRQHAELCFFHGDPLRPIHTRQRTLLEGWIPIVVYDWHDGTVGYTIEMFAAPLDGEDASNTVSFVRIEMRNAGLDPATGTLAAAMRNCGETKRWLQWEAVNNFKPDWQYEMSDDAVVRDGKLVYTFQPGAQCDAVPGVAYEQPFVGADHHVTSPAEVCVARYDQPLAPDERAAFVFKMPRVPVPTDDAAFIEKIREADFDTYRQQTIDYWHGVFADGMDVTIAEPRVESAFRANLVHVMIATRDDGKERTQTSGLNYPGFYANDFVDTRMTYDALGHAAYSDTFIPPIIERTITTDFTDDASIREWNHWPSHGQVIHTIAHHYLMTRDDAYAKSVYGTLKEAIDVLGKGLAVDEYGLVPLCGPYDNEAIKGHYTSHNLWALLGLRSGIRVARALGEDGDAQAWLALHDQLFASFEKALDASVSAEGYVPTGMYKIIVGPEANEKAVPDIFNNEWENGQLAWPTEVLSPDDPRVAGTLDKIHRLDYREGILGYRNGRGGCYSDLHGYSGNTLLYQLIAKGDQPQALTDLYFLLLHTDSTHGVWEQGCLSWANRDSVEWTAPHSWAAARMALSIRNMLVVEQGGRAGLDEDERDLRIFSVISPAWAEPGEKLAFTNAVTEMGTLSAEMAFAEDGATVTIDSDFHHPPAHIVLGVPYFVELESFECDADARQEGSSLILSPDATRVVMKWRTKAGAHDGTFQKLLTDLRAEPSVEIVDWKINYVPAPDVPMTDEESGHAPDPLSFRLVLDAYRCEYERRYAEFVEAGGVPFAVHAPPMLTADERRGDGPPQTAGAGVR